MGNRTSKTDQNGIANYTYDTLNRLIQATNPLPTNPLESYNYDAVGNRANSNQNGASLFNQSNQLTEDASFTYQYDNNGNLIRKTSKTGGPLTNYEYDAENKLVRAVVNGTTANYKYDGLGRRVEKEVISVSTTVTRYIYDNEDILLELDGSNNITARYTHGPGIDEPLVVEKGGASFFYHADGLGSITELTDAAGTVIQAYTYSSFGKIESQLDPSFVQPYAFTGREFDPETELYHYRERQYDWRTGRFNTEDPLLRTRPFLLPYLLVSVLPSPGRLHNYAYVVNEPVTLVDPSGLWGIGAVGGGTVEAGFGNGFGLQRNSGAGIFGGGNSGINLGGFTASGDFADVGNPKQFVVGATGGLGGGIFLTNAKCAQQLLGPFDTWSLNLPLVSFQYATDGTTRVVSIQAGRSLGFSFSRYPVVTTTASGSPCDCK